MTTCLVRHFSDLGFKKVVDEGGDEEREHDEVAPSGLGFMLHSFRFMVQGLGFRV